MRREERHNQESSQTQKQVLDYLQSHFGLEPSLFSDFCFYLTSKGRIYLGPRQIINQPKIVTLGIMIARADSGIKPTTNLFQVFGRHITKNILQLTKEQTIKYVKGEDMILHDTSAASDGYVLLKFNDYPLGCGLLKGKTLKNMMPKAKRLGLKYI